MTILDDRTGIARLGRTPLSILHEAIDRAEGDLDGLKWEVYDNADAEALSGLDVAQFPVLRKVRNEDVREEIDDHIESIKSRLEYEFNALGDELREAVLKVLRKMEDEIELELIRLSA